MEGGGLGGGRFGGSGDSLDSGSGQVRGASFTAGGSSGQSREANDGLGLTTSA